jgi:hypothetical protein
MSRAGFEAAIPATKRPQTYALDRAVTGIGLCQAWYTLYSSENSEALFPLILPSTAL